MPMGPYFQQRKDMENVRISVDLPRSWEHLSEQVSNCLLIQGLLNIGLEIVKTFFFLWYNCNFNHFPKHHIARLILPYVTQFGF